jgi:ribosomal protein S18 acetylase RimI-like enzyme
LTISAEAIAIRKARVEDADAIAWVHVASWRATYRGILSDTTLAALSVEERAAMWRQGLGILSQDSPPHQDACYVAMGADDAVLGFARGGRVRPLASGGPPEPYDGEIYAIYLTPGMTRRGTGARLVHALASHLAADGLSALLVWVLAANPSRGFYEALGGALLFEQDILIEGEMLTEVAYGWPDIHALIARTAPQV